MKKVYQSPKIKTIAMHQKVHLLIGSPDPSNRNIAGGPTNNGFSISVFEGFNPDDLTGGQNGVSNRSRDYDWFEE